MNENNMVKRDERTSINVSIETRDLVLELLYELQAQQKRRCTQDDIIRFLLNQYRASVE
jgi:hypothetical protein